MENQPQKAQKAGKSAQDRAAVEAQNRRKIEKDRRRKNYHDVQVQGTNNSSIVSKRSVEMLYHPVTEPGTHEWFSHFVPKGKRRSPAINRGYWVRMESIRQSVVLIQAHHGVCVQVVNLGCGFDPFAFKMLAEAPEKYVFFDLDYPELVAKKLAMITASPEIMAVIGQSRPISPQEKALGVVFSSEKYRLVGCDLKNSALYEQQLHELMSTETPSVFIAEVSLAYMKPEHANPVVKSSSVLKNSHVLVLEQIMPAGDRHFFAQKMLYHFDHLTSPLQCVQQYCTKDMQRRRFREFFPAVEVVDLFESWNQLVSAKSKALVQAVEDFDEWEEFIIFCQHYVVIHATNSGFQLFSAKKDGDGELPTQEIGMSALPSPLAKFSASAPGQKGVYSFGGMHQTRTDKMVLLPDQEIVSTGSPPARMCHTLTPIGDKLLLVGGRGRPGCHMQDVWLYDEHSQVWTRQADLDFGLSRHSAVPLNRNSVLVFHQGKFVKFELGQTLSHKELPVVSEVQLPRLTSAGFAYCRDTNSGYIVGGMVEETTPEISRTLFRFRVEDGTVAVSAVADSDVFARIGCMAKLSGSCLYVLGGAGHELQNQNTTIVRYDIESGELMGMRMPDEIWESGPLFVGSSLAQDAVVGGGAVCYSFGSSYNAGYQIQF